MKKNFIKKLCSVLFIVGGLVLIFFTVGFLVSFMRIPAGDFMAGIMKIVVLVIVLASLLEVILCLINYIYKINEDNNPLLFIKIYNAIFKYNLFDIIRIIGYSVGRVFWFGLLIILCFFAAKQKEYTMLLFSLPFWVAGIFEVYKTFKKK